MQRRRIPDLSLQGTTGQVNTQLQHITVVVRHGARTPTHGNHDCWPGYWNLPQGIWDCDLRTVLFATEPNPTTASRVAEENENGSDDKWGAFLVQKIYDAFELGDDGDDGASPYQNHLNGTCQTGQLIRQGADQLVTLGQILRERYFYDGSHPYNARLKLFDTSAVLRANNATPIKNIDDDRDRYPFAPKHLRFRSDDDQRTVASGQVLLQSMMKPELEAWRKSHPLPPQPGAMPVIPQHTADRSVDILSARQVGPCNANLRAAKDRAQQSKHFQKFNTSEEAVLMRKLISDDLGNPVNFNQDCIMTAMCTDRPLPDVINDYKGEDDDSGTTDSSGGNSDSDDEYTRKYGSNRFVRLRNYVSVAHASWLGL